MTRVLLVPDLPLERWPSMDRYAHRLHDWLESTDPGFEVRLAASIGDLTRDRGSGGNGRTSGGYPRWWAQEVDPTKLVLPGPMREPQRYVARYVLYPWWLRREARHAQGAAARARLHRGHRVAQARARDRAGRRPPHQRGAVRGGPRVLLRSPECARPRPGRLAHPGRRVRGAARGEHRRAKERAAGHQHGGTAARRGGRLPAAGGRTVLERATAADRAAGPQALRAHRAAGG